MKRPSNRPESQDNGNRRAVVAITLLLYTFAWIVVGIATRNTRLIDALRPYFASWALWALALSVPVTAALVGLRKVPWEITKLCMLILPIQGAIFGLVGEKYPYLQVGVTILVYFEAYLILPEWNRRASRDENESVLQLK